MSKRFTSSEKWQDIWYRKLPIKIKCLWDWLYTQCDIAGTISPDWELVSFQIGEKCDENDLKYFEKQIMHLPNGRLFLKDFIRFQYGELTNNCPAHRPVIALLNRLSIPIQYSINRVQEKEKEKDCIISNLKLVGKCDSLSSIPEELKQSFESFLEVYEMKHGKPHGKQIDGIMLDLLRIPKEFRLESITNSTTKGHKTIYDCRKFKDAEKTETPKGEWHPAPDRGGINAG